MFGTVDHALIEIHSILNRALRGMDERFAALFAEGGRLSIAPERVLRGLVLQVLYDIRSERLLCEQLHYNMLFRWFVRLAMEETVWHNSTDSKNRDRQSEFDAIRALLFGEVVEQARAAGLLSDEHFSVDGTPVQAWASIKSFVPKDGPPPERSDSTHNPKVDFRGQCYRNDTYASTTDPDARLCAKGERAGAIPALVGNVLTENRSGLAVDGDLALGGGQTETEAALTLLGRPPDRCRRTVGADKAYDSEPFVACYWQLGVTAHVAQKDYRYTTAGDTTAQRNSLVDSRTTRHIGYRLSQTVRTRRSNRSSATASSTAGRSARASCAGGTRCSRPPPWRCWLTNLWRTRIGRVDRKDSPAVLARPRAPLQSPSNSAPIDPENRRTIPPPQDCDVSKGRLQEKVGEFQRTANHLRAAIQRVISRKSNVR